MPTWPSLFMAWVHPCRTLPVFSMQPAPGPMRSHRRAACLGFSGQWPMGTAQTAHGRSAPSAAKGHQQPSRAQAGDCFLHLQAPRSQQGTKGRGIRIQLSKSSCPMTGSYFHTKPDKTSLRNLSCEAISALFSVCWMRKYWWHPEICGKQQRGVQQLVCWPVCASQSVSA